MGRDAGRGVANAKVSMIDLCACLPPLYPPLTPAARFYANNYRIYKPVRTLRYTLVVHTVRFPYIPFASSKPACGPAAARTRPRRPSPRPALSSWSRPRPSIRGCGCASRLTHPPPLGLLGPLHGLLLLLAAEHVLLEDAADDDDARALDEHGEERAHERLGEAEQKRVLWSDRGEREGWARG